MPGKSNRPSRRGGARTCRTWNFPWSTWRVHFRRTAILDVFQYLDDAAQRRLLDAAIAMLVPGARLVIRTGIEDGSSRMRITRTFDRIANLLGWMNAPPRHYPRADALRRTLDDAGLASTFTSLRGNTPFNNWLVVATKPAAG